MCPITRDSSVVGEYYKKLEFPILSQIVRDYLAIPSFRACFYYQRRPDYKEEIQAGAGHTKIRGLRNQGIIDENKPDPNVDDEELREEEKT